jgi:ADP-ribose pyrophosphatase YjhB (NUDIX family)
MDALCRPLKTTEVTMADNNYCMECGTHLDKRADKDSALLYCPKCERQVYQDPKVATCTFIANEAGAILLTMRALEPELGKWALPGGYVNRGEVVEDAAKREVLEETGLICLITELLGVYSIKDTSPILIVYRGQITGGILTPSNETPEVDFFAPSNLPLLAFPRDKEIIEAASLSS